VLVMANERVTVTLPAEVIEHIDKLEPNRSKFIQEAVWREIRRRRREALGDSLRNPHPETSDLAETGLDQWAKGLPHENISELVDLRAGRAVRWDPKRGWVDEK
jgi:hypothetical protein